MTRRFAGLHGLVRRTAPVIGLAGMVACIAPGPDKPDTSGGDTGGEDTLTDSGLELTQAKVPTVLHARWTTASPTRSDVTATFGDDTLVVSETEPTTEHHVRLVGLPALTEVNVSVVADETDGTAEAVAETGALPTWVPDLTFTADAPEASEGGFTVIPVILSDGGGTVIADAEGRVVWAWPATDEPNHAPATRARLSLDGRSILHNAPSGSAVDVGPIERVSLDGEEQEETPVTSGHTDFVEYTPGGLLALGWDIREIGDRKILADTIVEVAPDGTERTVWSAWDLFPWDEDAPTYTGIYPGDPTVEDWTHINGIAYSAEEDDVYVTSTYLDAVIRVDRSSGESVWWFSDFDGGNFANVEGTTRVSMPHSVQRLEDGILVFSREEPGHPELCSGAVEITLDEEAWTSEMTWEHRSPDCVFVPFLGGAERLAGGNTLVSWTTAGRVNEVTPEGEVTWQVSTALGAAFGFSTRVPGFGAE